MNEVPYFHTANCSPLLNTYQEESASGGELEQLRIQVGGLALPITIPAGQNASFTMTFSPRVSGAASATLSFTSNAFPLHATKRWAEAMPLSDCQRTLRPPGISISFARVLSPPRRRRRFCFPSATGMGQGFEMSKRIAAQRSAA